MACYRPIPAYQRDPGGPVKLWAEHGAANLAIPCGKCIGCRTARALMWADRCQHETTKYRNNIFVTLTYEDRHLPLHGHLDAAELQRFFKRLRKRAQYDRRCNSDRNHSIKYFASGEYGERNQRPHYHAIIFNTDFTDKQQTGTSRGKPLYHSALLRALWPYGEHVIGEASGAAANYVAQYSLKKIGAGDADPDGVWRPAPFLRASQGIGKDWLDKYATDLRKGYYTREGKPRKIPRYYLQKMEEYYPDIYEDCNAAGAKLPRGDKNHPDRLTASEIIHHRRKELTENKPL